MFENSPAYSCTLLATFMNEKKDDGYIFYHNVLLPFLPFVGLIIEYSHEKFDQGIDLGEVFVKEFCSRPIKYIKYDVSAQRFECYLNEMIVEDKNLDYWVNASLDGNWFPYYDREDNKFDRFIKYLDHRIYE